MTPDKTAKAKEILSTTFPSHLAANSELVPFKPYAPSQCMPNCKTYGDTMQKT